jgi:hypothetical protein
MPYLIMAIIGGAVGLYLVHTGRVTTRGLMGAAYAFLGGLLGIFLLRAALGALGPVGALIGAVTGAVVLLWAAKSLDRSD